MGALREFFTPQIFINSLVFSVPVSFLILWRASYNGDISFLSIEAVQLYVFSVIMLSSFFIIIFFVLFMLGGRRPEEDD